MINIEKQKKMFKNHVAKFTDYGNIKILDFQRPGHAEYRIRFLFQEDFFRLAQEDLKRQEMEVHHEEAGM